MSPDLKALFTPNSLGHLYRLYHISISNHLSFQQFFAFANTLNRIKCKWTDFFLVRDVNNINIADDGIRYIIRNFTSEQGVRELQREIASLLRRSLLQNDGIDVKTDFTIDKIDELLSVHQNANMTNKIGFSARL